MPASAAPVPTARMVARGRPAADPACAGCALLGVFRGLRRAGLDVAGGAGCDPDALPAPRAARGRFAAVTGARAALRDAGAVLAAAAATGARLLVVADRGAGAAEVTAALARAGARAVSIDPGDLAAAEAAARRAADAGEGGLAAVVALSACRRGAPAAAPFAIAPSRCNRCGACLGLGCPAIADGGGEAMVIDAATCTGCGLCAPLCRGRAIVR